MNEGLRNFGLWFDGFVAACGGVPDPDQWETLKRKIEMLTLDPERLYVPKLNVPEGFPDYGTGKLRLDSDKVVPRYQDGEGV